MLAECLMLVMLLCMYLHVLIRSLRESLGSVMGGFLVYKVSFPWMATVRIFCGGSVPSLQYHGAHLCNCVK